MRLIIAIMSIFILGMGCPTVSTASDVTPNSYNIQDRVSQDGFNTAFDVSLDFSVMQNLTNPVNYGFVYENTYSLELIGECYQSIIRSDKSIEVGWQIKADKYTNKVNDQNISRLKNSVSHKDPGLRGLSS